MQQAGVSRLMRFSANSVLSVARFFIVPKDLIFSTVSRNDIVGVNEIIRCVRD